LSSSAGKTTLNQLARMGRAPTEIRVHRLAAGDDEHQRTQDEEGIERTGVSKKRKTINGIEGREYLRAQPDLPDAKPGDDDKPDGQNWTENNADARSALILNGKQNGQKTDRDRYNRIA
jgi:hypothetical protein